MLKIHLLLKKEDIDREKMIENKIPSDTLSPLAANNNSCFLQSQPDSMPQKNPDKSLRPLNNMLKM
ncbi:hypothetical protein RCG23_22335 [Neobacillus sp. PS3-34]|uniref:hypothetical protein n=1 Tax=Neobacillus sp. PS3-34 TaxID=3070678 RepID=UPI0027E1A604|nr:hypothetical protein [Neobacillus sp. PS3-34]WML48000.1 hypothetical protein RCG23_22335 [Neobacillus sp. PS3-34]